MGSGCICSEIRTLWNFCIAWCRVRGYTLSIKVTKTVKLKDLLIFWGSNFSSKLKDKCCPQLSLRITALLLSTEYWSLVIVIFFGGIFQHIIKVKQLWAYNKQKCFHFIFEVKRTWTFLTLSPLYSGCHVQEWNKATIKTINMFLPFIQTDASDGILCSVMKLKVRNGDLFYISTYSIYLTGTITVVQWLCCDWTSISLWYCKAAYLSTP